MALRQFVCDMTLLLLMKCKVRLGGTTYLIERRDVKCRGLAIDSYHALIARGLRYTYGTARRGLRPHSTPRHYPVLPRYLVQ